MYDGCIAKKKAERKGGNMGCMPEQMNAELNVFLNECVSLPLLLVLRCAQAARPAATL